MGEAVRGHDEMMPLRFALELLTLVAVEPVMNENAESRRESLGLFAPIADDRRGTYEKKRFLESAFLLEMQQERQDLNRLP